MEKLTHEQLNQRAQEVFERKKNTETKELDKEKLTKEEEKLDEHLKKISEQDDNFDVKKKIEKDTISISNLKDEKTQLEALTKLCFTKGPKFAIKVAKGLSDNVLDSLHSTLVKNEIYEQLKEKNII